MSTHLRVVVPRHENRSVPNRPTNSELRTREYLTPEEVEKLIKATKDGRYCHRDATLSPNRLPARPAGNRDLRFGMVAGRVWPLGFAACQAGEERQTERSPAPGR
jgi:hypothetical protein